MEIDLVALEGMLNRQLKLIRASRGLMNRIGVESELLRSMGKETKEGLDAVRRRLREIEEDNHRPLIDGQIGEKSPQRKEEGNMNS